MLVLALIVVQLYFAVGLFPSRPTPTVCREYDDGGDPGTPLFLTPFIESGQVEEARRMSRVTLPDVPQLESYSGLFTVNKTYNSNQFFWYFPAMNKTSDAVILWLQGGPGISSLFGLFGENGPILVENINNSRKFLHRDYHWAQDYHLIYIDNPVGTGFSFTDDPRGYCTDQTQIGEQLYATLLQFMKLFPQLKEKKFFITGEEYAGKYIPTLGHTIHEKNRSSKVKINLRGMFIGNGWCDPIHQLEYHEFSYQLGLHDWDTAQKLKKAEDEVKGLIKREKWLEAIDKLSYLNKLIYSRSISLNNILDEADANDLFQEEFIPLIKASLVRKAIHVGNVKYSLKSPDVLKSLWKEEYFKSVAPWLTELLDYYPVIFYNGQLANRYTYTSTLNFLRHLDFRGSEKYRKPDFRAIAYIDDMQTVIGYAHVAGNLVEFLFRDAGQMIPKDQPIWALNFVDLFVKHSVMPIDLVNFKEKMEIGNITLIKPKFKDLFDMDSNSAVH